MDIDSINIDGLKLSIGKKYTIIIPEIKEYIHVILVNIDIDGEEIMLIFDLKNRIKDEFSGDIIINKLGDYYTAGNFVVTFEKGFVNKENYVETDLITEDDIDYVMDLFSTTNV